MELGFGPNFPELNWGGNRKRTKSKRASKQEVTYYLVLTTITWRKFRFQEFSVNGTEFWFLLGVTDRWSSTSSTLVLSVPLVWCPSEAPTIFPIWLCSGPGHDRTSVVGVFFLLFEENLRFQFWFLKKKRLKVQWVQVWARLFSIIKPSVSILTLFF